MQESHLCTGELKDPVKSVGLQLTSESCVSLYQEAKGSMLKGPEAENTEVLPYLEKELSEDRDSPEISLLSNIATTVSGMVAVEEKSLIETEKISAAPKKSYHPGKEVTLTMISKETNNEESSLETFVSALEKLLRSPESTQEKRLFKTMNDFDTGELMNALSNSSSSMSVSLSALSPYCRDLLENAEDDALPPELLAALNTLSEDKTELICHRKKEGGSLRGRNEYLEPDSSQTNEDCTQITETVKDSNPFESPSLARQNVTSCDPLNNKNPNPMDNGSDQETPCVLRRSSRLEELKISRDAECTDDMYKMPEKIVPKMHSCEDQINNKSIENFRMQDPVLMIEDKKNISRFKGKQIRKNERLILKKEKLKINKMPLSGINRRNVFGETLLYRAALYDDADLVQCCIKKGANVNQPSYAGWTALHEASVGGFYRTANELLKGGADVNIKGMYQITPLHDAVVNGHHKVAELLLLSGADPLFRSDNGKCALDEAKDSRMKRLLEKYVPQCQKHLTSDQRKRIDTRDVEDVHQHKKTKFSPKNRTGFVCNENSNRQKPEHVEVNKRSKEGFFINEDIYECYPQNSKITRFGKSKHKQSTLYQTYATGLKKGNLCNIKDTSTNVSEGKGRKNTQDKRTQANDGDCTSRQAIAISSSKRINTLVTCQQHILQTLDDLSEESHEPSSPTLSSLKDGLVNSVAICSVSKEAHTRHLDLSEGQEMQFFGLEYIGQTESGSFSTPSLHKEVKLPLVSTDQPHVYQEQQCSPYISHKNSNSGKKVKTFNKWENSFLSFVKEHSYNYNGDFCIAETAITSEMVTCSTECKNYYQENLRNREERDFQQLLPSEDHFLQESELKESSLTTFPQQEAVNISNSDKAVISEQHVANYEQCIYGTSFDHSFGNREQTSLACTRTVSTHEVSKLTSHVEKLKKPQDNSPRESTPLVNQIDTHIMEKVYVELKEETERNSSDKGQKPRLFPTVVHSQKIEIINVEKNNEYLPENELIPNKNFCSTKNMNKELTNISEFNQQEKEISHKPVLLGKFAEMKTTGISKRNARGESQLHSAARRGDLSLVQILIESGADVNLKDNAGWTPLHEASNEGFSDIIVELLKAGANVNCESIHGILPLHKAVASNHLKVTEILLQHGANPNQEDQTQKTALDEADNEKMKELLKSYGAIETNNRDESNAAVTVKSPTVWSKRYKQCLGVEDETVDPPTPSHQEERRENFPVHQTISAILQDIEENQETLLEFEIRNSKDAEQYIKRMLEIKEIMDNVLSKQKAERDDLAKKYRVSVESFKHGVLREQLANLATRQKKLLVAAKKQKNISLKIQNYKNVTSLSGLPSRKLSSSLDISSDKESQELTRLENVVQPQLSPFSAVNLDCGSVGETPLSPETWNDGQNTNICLNSKKFSRSEMNLKQNESDCTLDGFSNSIHSDTTEKIKLSSQQATFIAQTEHSQKENDLIEMIAKDHEFCSPSATTSSLNISECTSSLSQNDPYLSTVISDQDLYHCDPKRRNKKTASQLPPGGVSESVAHQRSAVLGTYTGHALKPCLKKAASAIPRANDRQISSSFESSHQHTIKNPSSFSTTPKKKCMEIKDLMLLGRINPGNNILEFRTQETTHKASILMSGKIKVENGQIYQNPVTWLKDLLGGDSYVTWNYAWILQDGSSGSGGVSVPALWSEVNHYRQNGDFTQALKTINKINKDNITALHCKVVCLIQNGSFKEALNVINMHTKVLANNTVSFEKEHCEYRLNRIESALKATESANQKTEKLKDLYGKVLYRLERYDECLAVYRDLMRKSQDDYDEKRKTNLSAVVAAPSNWEKMVPENLGLQEGTHELCYNTACALIGQGQLSQAMKILQKAKDLCH
ncbi:Ankyrin repeat domain-containing protein 31 [Heterocephalus glaber]|uniref:Signal recognition particle subunit SRP72 n=1 Tax=Heterocephalus glaber TaxID=10181 RepID=G5AVZ5_HETGA|nr:Ankyrin repeat domain-containing protein 31 [Heterocephalus glaber]